ncbi:PIN domain-containing protein [Nocardioides acrostichi]|uniref:Ribonuclease VapC n=1 Tax=Nocardioides acrostichi TaxID=2784339 RepID=A0A930V2C6_9ACTN|nr:PIN domain-containing protein [Nocardioides acrostichi]MBF4162749.1 PIN domain-containing protein [Nocardioides acrostichi]
MTLIADTGAIYACYDRADAHHVAAAAFMRAFDGRPQVPALVLAELDHLVGARLGEGARATVIADVLDVMDVVPFDSDVASRAAEVAGLYGDFPLGLTDASLVVHAHDLRTVDLFTVDQRHFRAVAPRWGADAFRLLPFDGDDPPEAPGRPPQRM